MHTIKFVARQTGLSPHTIRAWERRYTALSPDRSATNRRLYSTEDIEKLTLLQKALQEGHSIGQIANLSSAELQGLLTAKDASEPEPRAKPPAVTETGTTLSHLEECLRAVERMDTGALEDGLTRASALLGAAATMEQVILPLLQSIGENWHEGEMRIVHEHLATAVVRTFLGRTLSAFQPPAHAPCLVVTTPAGQMHELGALIAAITAASDGWRVLYLGPNLPADEIAGAVHQSGARVVALSVVHPPDDPRLPHEFATLRKGLGQAVTILVGGQGAGGYSSSLESIGAIVIEDLKRLRQQLQAIRTKPPLPLISG